VIRAEFTREIDALNQLRGKFKDNIKVEGDRQIEKLNEIKKKFDRDGVNFVSNEGEIGRNPQQANDPTNLGPK